MPSSEQSFKKTPIAGFNRLRKDQLRYILDNISDLLCLHDLDGNILAVNRSWQNESGILDANWFNGKSIYLFIPAGFHQKVRDYLNELAEKGSASGIVSLSPEKSRARVKQYNSLCIKDAEGHPIVVSCIGPDITERLKSEKALKRSEEKYRRILETIEDGYYEVDLNGRVTFCNPSFCRILGYSEDELQKMSFRDICDPAYTDPIYRTFLDAYQSRKPTKAFDWKLVRKNGGFCFVEISISLIDDKDHQITGFRGICRDITERIEAEKERQSLEAQLFSSQKTEALGTLAAGFAHNFNNILFPLIGYIDMTLMDLPEESRQRKHLQKALESANRAKDIIRRVQEYTRNDKGQQVQAIEIPETVNQALRLVRGSLSRRIGLSVDLPDVCPAVIADADQIEQVVVNICTNAAEAIAVKGGGGAIAVRVCPEEITHPANPDRLASGAYVRISIEDSGCGIDPDVGDRIFDPFYTTKAETGKGLGLSLSQRIVKKYGGEICIQSKPEAGTTVTVYLPQAPGETAAAS
ncbi:MAG: PAS domain S-box protein [Thermodesulfobacteriota bacterium]